MAANKLCPYIYGKGSKEGQQCNKKCINEFCHIHKPKTPKIKSSPKKESEEDDNETIISTISVEDEDDKKCPSVKSSHVSKVSNNDDTILLTKYFVYDCIRDFLRDYNDINQVLGNKQPTQQSSSNMTSILAMAGIGCLPILLKNISGSNITDALFKQANNNTTCDSTRLHNQYEQVGNNTTQERTSQERTEKDSAFSANGREISQTTESNNKGFRIV